MTEELHVSPLFTALTRPPMIMGITLNYLALSSLCSLCAYILMNSVLYLVLYLPLHVIGYLACLYDPFIFSILQTKTHCPRIKYARLWGGQSYAPE